MLVKRRVDEELEKRKDEIELEVTRRVEAAKQQMEQEMMAELERRREKAREDERKREVGLTHYIQGGHTHTHSHSRLIYTHIAVTLPDYVKTNPPFTWCPYSRSSYFIMYW